MTFVKLDCGILTSTLWIDKDARDLFITALLMATPWELTRPTPAIEVRTLSPLGFTVPPGWYGFVPAAGVGIIRTCGMDQEKGYGALERLASPDNESRSQDFEGRRMVRVDGGYLILNYDKHRQKDHTAAERSQRYRNRLKALQTPGRHTVTPLRHTVTTRSVTQEEEEEEEKKEGEAAPEPKGQEAGDLSVPSSTPAIDPDARWDYERLQPWVYQLTQVHCKIHRTNWSVWHAMSKSHGQGKLVTAASMVQSDERWPERVAAALDSDEFRPYAPEILQIEARIRAEEAKTKKRVK